MVNLAAGSPFGEFSLKKNFNFEFKPIPLKPIHLFMEKWSPFGKFGMKHGIEKRDLNKIASVEETGGIEHRLPVEVHEMEQLGPVAFPRQELARVPIMQTPIEPNWVGPVEHFGIGPVPAPPPPRVVITSPPPMVQPIPGLHTNIVRDKLIDSYLKDVGPAPHEINSIEKTIVPEKEEPVESDPFVRGSKLVITFGSLLLDIISRFLGRPVVPVKE